MVILTPVIIGAIIGALAAWVFHREDHTGWNIIYGIAGALVGWVIVAIFWHPHYNMRPISGVGVLGSLLGALAATLLAKLFRPIKTLHQESDGHSQDEAEKDE